MARRFPDFAGSQLDGRATLFVDWAFEQEVSLLCPHASRPLFDEAETGFQLLENHKLPGRVRLRRWAAGNLYLCLCCHHHNCGIILNYQ